MSLQVVSGDILDCNFQYICHQCNCISYKSKHLAKDIFCKFPYADIYTGRKSGDHCMGDIIVKGNGKNERYVINMLAQFYPGRPKYTESKLDGFKARELAFSTCLAKIAQIEGLETIAFPYGIGCGAASGNWTAYQCMIEEFSDKVGDSVKVVLIKKP